MSNKTDFMKEVEDTYTKYLEGAIPGSVISVSATGSNEVNVVVDGETTVVPLKVDTTELEARFPAISGRCCSGPSKGVSSGGCCG